MDAARTGAVVRAVRIRSRLTQAQVAAAARVSRGTVSRIERGHLAEVTFGTFGAICTVLEIRADVVPRWRGGELDRLLNAEHARLLEVVSRRIARLVGWISVPEVTFSIFGERGSIDLVAWHAASRSLLVVELKTAIVDIHDLLATLDRKRRLARQIGRERGWEAASISVWVAVTDTATNRRRVAAHEVALRSALRSPGVEVGRWLRRPSGPIAGLSFLSYARHESTRSTRRGVQRVRRAKAAAA
ncbi:MAG TPA: helix-turn-helix domain-containing protein [Candidatus Limnocylindrales bacterium]|nr:helix-turn-helix domain-containing protein [Candidatus Limnocylindrales bacterium]